MNPIIESNYILIRLKSSRLCEAYEAGKLKGKLREVASRLKDDDNDVFAFIRLNKKWTDGSRSGCFIEGNGAFVCLTK